MTHHPHSFRLVMENDSVFIFHSTENGRVYHKRPIQSIEIDDDVCIINVFSYINKKNYIAMNINTNTSSFKLIRIMNVICLHCLYLYIFSIKFDFY